MKQTKQILTVEEIKVKLCGNKKGNILLLISEVLGCLLLLAFFIPMSINFSSAFVLPEEPDIYDLGLLISEILLIASSVVIAAVPCWFVVSYLKEMNAIKNNKFYVLEDTLYRKAVQEPERRTGSKYTHYYDAFYFSKTGRFVPSQIEFDLADEDDKFYVVVFEGREDQPVLAYNCKMYELKNQ